ncbi:MAG: TetR/AcrR family transcriptional regulator [Pseudomonadota bacterium]
MTKRKYTKSLRSRQENGTRQKIMDAALELYGLCGPAKTTISAIAGRAGVQRLTVARHFPDDGDLIQGCFFRWFSRHPLPSAERWRGVVNRADWAVVILSLIYSYYRQTSDMWDVVHRDAPSVPELGRVLQVLADCHEQLQDDILASLPEDIRDGRFGRAVTAHAVQFTTWQSLSAQHLDDADMAALMSYWLRKCPAG